MTPRGRMFLYLLLAFAAGHVVARFTSPVCRVTQPGAGVPRLRNTAQALLMLDDTVSRIRPALEPIAAGQVPSPYDLLRIGTELAR